MIMFILAGAKFLSMTMAYTGIPRALAEWVAALDLPPYALIAVLCVVYIVLGTALDGISMIVLTSAVVLPMIQKAGFDLIWFGIFIVLLVEIAEVTPPVGFNLFVLQNMTGRDSNTIARMSLPFFALLIVCIALITAVPGDRDLAARRGDGRRQVSIFEEPKIDCHVHVLDPVRFPYGASTHYRPAGQEMGTPAQLAQVMDAYGSRCALLVGPNSGYGLDNSCMLDTLAQGGGRYKGIAVVGNDATFDELQRLKGIGVLGVAWNVTYYGVDHYRDAAPLLEKLAALDLFVDIQVEHDQLVRMMPLLAQSGVRVLVDHCGRPTIDAGLDQPGFRALLELGSTGRAFVKLSGLVKFSREPSPHHDAWPFVQALVEAFTLDRCLWASDWPYLRAPARVDYGVLLNLVLTTLSRCVRAAQAAVGHTARAAGIRVVSRDSARWPAGASRRRFVTATCALLVPLRVERRRQRSLPCR